MSPQALPVIAIGTESIAVTSWISTLTCSQKTSETFKSSSSWSNLEAYALCGWTVATWYQWDFPSPGQVSSSVSASCVRMPHSSPPAGRHHKISISMSENLHTLPKPERQIRVFSTSKLCWILQMWVEGSFPSLCHQSINIKFVVLYSLPGD